MRSGEVPALRRSPPRRARLRDLRDRASRSCPERLPGIKRYSMLG